MVIITHIAVKQFTEITLISHGESEWCVLGMLYAFNWLCCCKCYYNIDNTICLFVRSFIWISVIFIAAAAVFSEQFVCFCSVQCTRIAFTQTPRENPPHLHDWLRTQFSTFGSQNATPNPLIIMQHIFCNLIRFNWMFASIASEIPAFFPFFFFFVETLTKTNCEHVALCVAFSIELTNGKHEEKAIQNTNLFEYN